MCPLARSLLALFEVGSANLMWLDMVVGLSVMGASRVGEDWSGRHRCRRESFERDHCLRRTKPRVSSPQGLHVERQETRDDRMWNIYMQRRVIRVDH